MFKQISEHTNIPEEPGLYFIRLSKHSNLHKFGNRFTIIYIGKALDNIRHRLLEQHFCTGRTGSSSLRRSLGAILKTELSLEAVPRSNNEKDKHRFTNYSFLFDGDEQLTFWMKSHLECCFLEHAKMNCEDTNSSLKKVEIRYTKRYLPTLDLDPATRKYNKFAQELSVFRKICSEEAKSLNLKYYDTK